MKRIGTSLLLLCPLVLAGCGETNPDVLYSFQMGKQSGSHMTASITLKQEDYVAKEKTLGKKMVFFLQANMGATSASSEESLSSEAITSASEGVSTIQDGGIFSDFEDFLMDKLADGITLEGWYSIMEKTSDGRNRMPIGFDLGSLLPEVGESIPIEPDVIEKLVYCETDGASIYLSIPVSVADIVFQLYWYGFDLTGFADVTEHPVNTHPTADDIAEINKTYPETHGGQKYRDFHCISLGLKKQ